jgi:hypothetical protein
MQILAQFIFRMSFGLALGMALTPPRLVTSGYYRNHLYVLLGFNVLATLIALSLPAQFALWPPLGAAVVSYVGAVIWLYEKPRAGIVALLTVSALSLAGGLMGSAATHDATPVGLALNWIDMPLSGMVLGFTLAAMLLGHWYLNAPGMAISPLNRLVVLTGIALALRAAACGWGAALQWQSAGFPETVQIMLLAVRWLFGFVLAGAALVMAFQTLKIPNTQSATGILYVAVIATFLGELVSLMLSSATQFPV